MLRFRSRSSRIRNCCLTTYPSEVAKQVLCDIANAVRKSGDADLQSADIQIALTSSLVVKTTAGGKVGVGIPIFAGVNIAPSLSLSDARTTSTTGLTEISVRLESSLPDADCLKITVDPVWVTAELVTSQVIFPNVNIQDAQRGQPICGHKAEWRRLRLKYFLGINRANIECREGCCPTGMHRF